ncbi:PH domain-containing protein [Sphaerisporangium sp. B11E5]|uniref:PH domain-containing protein n=1 Tax=Sphaerisporangium sp. B11E5 TaxID=3153563 RepID=UPI00325E521D
MILLIDPVRMAPSLLVPLAGVLFVGGFSQASFLWALVAVVGSIGFAALRWATTTYQVTADRLQISRSLISRSVRSIPLDRIRGVDVSTPPLHRLLGLAVVKVDTGASGGDKQEGELNGVSVAEAEHLRAVLLRRSRAVRRAPGAEVAGREADMTAPAPTGEPAVQPDHVYVRVPKKWFRYGPLSATYLFAPFALLGGAIGLVFQWGENFGISERAAWNFAEWLWHRPVLLVLIAVALVVVSPLGACVMYGVFNWNFTLLRRDASLIAERGLINRRSVSLEHARIRGYEFAEGLLERAANVGRLWAVVTGLGDSRTRGQLLPTGPKDFVLKIAAQAVAPFTTGLTPHPPQARRRRLFRAVAPALALALAAFVLGWTWLGIAALILAALGIPLGLDRYRSLGHAYDGTRLSVRSGSLPRSQAVIERRAVVGWTIRQTWFQRKANVLTVIAGVGAGTGGYSAIDAGDSQGVHFAATVTPDWLAPFLTTPPPPAPPLSDTP